jgi:hypothetical protein
VELVALINWIGAAEAPIASSRAKDITKKAKSLLPL